MPALSALHSTGAAGAQSSILLGYKMAAAKGDAEIDAIPDNVILILWPTLKRLPAESRLTPAEGLAPAWKTWADDPRPLVEGKPVWECPKWNGPRRTRKRPRVRWRIWRGSERRGALMKVIQSGPAQAALASDVHACGYGSVLCFLYSAKAASASAVRPWRR